MGSINFTSAVFSDMIIQANLFASISVGLQFGHVHSVQPGGHFFHDGLETAFLER